jgi:integrase
MYRKSMRPLGAAVKQVLQNLPKHQYCEFVFAGARLTAPYQGTKGEIRRMLEKTKIPNASSHTLRHTFASIASELGYSDATIAGLLGHQEGRSVTSRYVASSRQVAVSCVDVVAAKVDQLLTRATLSPMAA